MPSILIVRGQLATPWELRPWLRLSERYEVSYLLSGSNRFAAPEGLRAVPARTLRDMLPGGTLGELSSAVLGDRYLDVSSAFDRADIVHAAELSFWFAAEAARRKQGRRFKLVQTVWETLPMMRAYRNHRARRNRDAVLRATDLFLPATERAAQALALEGVAAERMIVCPPGIDLARFGGSRGAGPIPAGGSAAADGLTAGGPAATRDTEEHTIVSPGRLVWEKGHHDVLRAMAALHRGVVTRPDGTAVKPRLKMVGVGPEEQRLREYAAELGLAGSVEIGGVPYEQMPGVFADASAMVLASLSVATAALHPFDMPRAFWEEQFGLVLAEAMAAGLAIVTTTSGAIPEVVAGTPAELVAPGDWMGIARALAAGPLSRPPASRVAYPSEVIERYSTDAAARRLEAVYDSLLSG